MKAAPLFNQIIVIFLKGIKEMPPQKLKRQLTGCADNK